MRLAVDGSLDPTFGTGGFAPIDFNRSSRPTAWSSMAVVVGRTREGPSADGFVIRLRADGSPDPTFAGGTGIVVDLGGQEELEGALVLPDGRIVTVGWSNHTGDYNFLVAVLRDDGTLDASVGTGGLLEIDVVAGHDDLGWGSRAIRAGASWRLARLGATWRD